MFPFQILNESNKDPYRIPCFFPKKTIMSWKKHVAGETLDPGRVWNRTQLESNDLSFVFESVDVQ